MTLGLHEVVKGFHLGLRLNELLRDLLRLLHGSNPSAGRCDGIGEVWESHCGGFGLRGGFFEFLPAVHHPSGELRTELRDDNQTGAFVEEVDLGI